MNWKEMPQCDMVEGMLFVEQFKQILRVADFIELFLLKDLWLM